MVKAQYFSNTLWSFTLHYLQTSFFERNLYNFFSCCTVLLMKYWGQNGHLSLSPKLSSKMLIFWNYLAKYSCFKLDFLKIEFQWKTRFLKNRVIGKKLKKKKLHGTRVPCNILQVTRFSLNRVAHWN